MRLSTTGAALSRADSSAPGSRGVSCEHCSGRKQSCLPSDWQAGLFCSFAPPQISCASAGWEHLPRRFNIGAEGGRGPAGRPGRRCVGGPGFSSLGSVDGPGPGTGHFQLGNILIKSGLFNERPFLREDQHLVHDRRSLSTLPPRCFQSLGI